MINATLVSTGDFGIQLDLNRAIDAKFIEAIERKYFRLDIHLNNNIVTFKKLASIDYSQVITVNIAQMAIDITAADETDFITQLIAFDIEYWDFDEDGELVYNGFHTCRTIEQEAGTIYEPNEVVEGTNVPTIANVIRELALRQAVAISGGGWNYKAVSGYDVLKVLTTDSEGNLKWLSL